MLSRHSVHTRVSRLNLMRITRNYSDLRRLDTFEDRFDYLMLKGQVGNSTFGFDRYINQMFYASAEWKAARRNAIARDLGCDLGIEGFDIQTGLLVHHIQPMTPDDIEEGNPLILSLDNLITTTHTTHNAIHYGDASLLPKPFTERRPGDTRPW